MEFGSVFCFLPARPDAADTHVAHTSPPAASAGVPPSPQPRLTTVSVKTTAAAPVGLNPDTNVLSVHLNCLKKKVSSSLEPPCECPQCGAVFSPANYNSSTRELCCPFCFNTTKADPLPAHLCSEHDMKDFLIAPTGRAGAGAPQPNEACNTVVFCLDVSGSMCVTYEMDGRVGLRGAGLRQLEIDHIQTDGSDQYLLGQRRNVTYVSRLQALQAAVSEQLRHLALHHPSASVGLVAFSSDIAIIGDACKRRIVVSGDDLCNYDALMKIGEGVDLSRHIDDVCHQLDDELFELRDGGQTALGPAMLIAIAAAASRGGGRVVVCTDGLANTGIGSLDDEVSFTEAVGFYERISEHAQRNGVSVSVVGIKGTDAHLDLLGNICDATGGKVNTVDPQQLASNFHSILSEPILGTDVCMKVYVHPQMLVWSASASPAPIAEASLGTVTANTELSFEYGIRKDPDWDEVYRLERLPFQLQIDFTDLQGKRWRRVVPATQAVTQSQAAAEENANLKVLVLNAVKSPAIMAQKGHFHSSLTSSNSYRNLISRVQVKSPHLDPSIISQYEQHRQCLESSVRQLLLQAHGWDASDTPLEMVVPSSTAGDLHTSSTSKTVCGSARPRPPKFSFIPYSSCGNLSTLAAPAAPSTTSLSLLSTAPAAAFSASPPVLSSSMPSSPTQALPPACPRPPPLDIDEDFILDGGPAPPSSSSVSYSDKFDDAPEEKVQEMEKSRDEHASLLWNMRQLSFHHC